jgi:hypothetical protein
MLAVGINGWLDVLALVGAAALLGAGLLVVILGWRLGWRALRERGDEISTQPEHKQEEEP